MRPDWSDFRTVETLCRRAGVDRGRLAAVVVKELVDNALDAGANCKLEVLPGSGFAVVDDGAGIPGDVAEFFSFRRPFMSSKLLRRPTRGMLGNGLRVVAGAVYASGGTLRVATGGREYHLAHRDDGGALATATGAYDLPGTRVEVWLGPSIPVSAQSFEWGERALLLAKGGETFSGRPSPAWFDSDSFFELLQASGQRSARALIEELDGCSGAKAGRVASAFRNRPAASLTRAEADSLLEGARAHCRPFKPQRLGEVGEALVPGGYARVEGSFNVDPARGTLSAQIPVVVEVWAAPGGPLVDVHVNRTPVTSDVVSWHDKTGQGVFGCGLRKEITVGRRALAIWINVLAPYLPLVSDGKGPDLGVIFDLVEAAIGKAVARAKRSAPAATMAKARTQKEIVLEALPRAIAKASGDGQYRYSLRQLFYAVRPFILDELGIEPRYETFADIVGEIEAGQGHDLPGIFRDTRGTLYHPHTSQEIPLGTLAVEAYKRPAWTFNKVIYSEKEGFFSVLKSARWPERHDCALLTSKGFASRAARDLLDLLGAGDEEIEFFAIHDADGPGTMIFEALQAATKARPGRTVHIVNLGLEPEEALAMHLQVERVDRKNAVPVAAYVPPEWRAWLQSHRVELNAMTTPQFLAWLDAKMQRYSGKVIPPQPVLGARLALDVRETAREALVAKILREAGLEMLLEDVLLDLGPEVADAEAGLRRLVGLALNQQEAVQWSEPVRAVARALAADCASGDRGRRNRGEATDG